LHEVAGDDADPVRVQAERLDTVRSSWIATPLMPSGAHGRLYLLRATQACPVVPPVRRQVV
jgi:hypothetical protein